MSIKEVKNDIDLLESKKIVVVGDSGVGKSSILYRFVYDEFEKKPPTMAAGFKTKSVQFKDHEDKQ